MESCELGRMLLLKTSTLNWLAVAAGEVRYDISLKNGGQPEKPEPHHEELSAHCPVLTNWSSKKSKVGTLHGSIAFLLRRSTRSCVLVGGSHCTVASFQYLKTTLGVAAPAGDGTKTGTHWPSGSCTVVIRGLMLQRDGSDQPMVGLKERPNTATATKLGVHTSSAMSTAFWKPGKSVGSKKPNSGEHTSANASIEFEVLPTLRGVKEKGRVVRGGGGLVFVRCIWRLNAQVGGAAGIVSKDLDNDTLGDGKEAAAQQCQNHARH